MGTSWRVLVVVETYLEWRACCLNWLGSQVPSEHVEGNPDRVAVLVVPTYT